MYLIIRALNNATDLLKREKVKRAPHVGDTLGCRNWVVKKKIKVKKVK